MTSQIHLIRYPVFQKFWKSIFGALRRSESEAIDSMDNLPKSGSFPQKDVILFPKETERTRFTLNNNHRYNSASIFNVREEVEQILGV